MLEIGITWKRGGFLLGLERVKLW